ncbi:MAG: hypothetical protein NT178_18515, partial [Proteobacteria bacterium]|nr:hypothetical protein [Pseudomonadota bacterium]
MRTIGLMPRRIDYLTKDGITRISTADESKWGYIIYKELIDNSLDTLDEHFAERKITHKKIKIEFNENIFSIKDGCGGIPEEILDATHRLDAYISNKMDQRIPTRGFLGNALKLVAGICHVWDLRLFFITQGKKVMYIVDEEKLEFKKNILADKQEDCIVIEGNIRLTYEDAEALLQQYNLCNPDVEFILNDKLFKARAEPKKKVINTSPYWHTIQSFRKYMESRSRYDHSITVKQLCHNLIGMQRISLNLDKIPKKLSECLRKGSDIPERLLADLKNNTQKPGAGVLRKHLIGRDQVLKYFGESSLAGYKYYLSTEKERTAPYAIEGFCISTKNEDINAVIPLVNNSVTYGDDPFEFNHKEIIFCKKEYYTNSLNRLLSEASFFKGKGKYLLIHLVSPLIEIKDTAKAKIISDDFIDRLKTIVEHLCANTIFEINKKLKEEIVKEHEDTQKKNERRLQKKIQPEEKSKRTNKTGLMRDYFMKGYSTASGEKEYPVTIRQIFYATREMINKEHGINLIQSDYENAFTQKIATEFIEKDLERKASGLSNDNLENRVLFERRGYFQDPFSKNELPLGTKEVIEFITKKFSSGAERRSDFNDSHYYLSFDIPYELRFNHVLFVEKAGFNIIFKESGLLDDLNLGVMSTQGFGTRALKRLVDFFIQKGIKVYVLHDCDIAGYLIKERLAKGSPTFPKGLAVTPIGLTLEDVDKLGKRDQAEELSYDRKYNKSLNMFTDEERKFFVVDKEKNIYRRVELNTLTSPE